MLDLMTDEEIAVMNQLKKDFEHHGNKDAFYWYVRYRTAKEEANNYKLSWERIMHNIALKEQGQ